MADSLMDVRGFIIKQDFPQPVQLISLDKKITSEKYICHCDDVRLDEILDVIGSRKFISVDEVKHTTRLGMGACRGKRCIKRLKQTLKPYGITLVGDATPRGPMSNQVAIGEMYPSVKNGAGNSV
jgi:NAD(P)H-nitrite reductase large subunit